jgi:enterochelin esterase-like enzyme
MKLAIFCRVLGVLSIAGVLPFSTAASCAAEGSELSSEVRIAPATIDERGVKTHVVECPYQRGPTKVQIALPKVLEESKAYPVVYVLPVEANEEHRYGDGLAEVLKLDLPNKYRAIFVAPTYADLPWYSDHPTDKQLQQETYFLEVVVPLVEKLYPANKSAEGRLLLGFSKSGWGAWSLLLRHPDRFGRAAAWDAPLMLAAPGKYGSGPIFGTPDNFEKYCITQLLEQSKFESDRRLILLGQGNFQREHQQVHALMDRLKVPHTYRVGEMRRHDWHSGWVAEAAELLFTK